ncbi:uncharacterized protein PgNI_00068 [Pyricularia grisea]|uniref:Uncharacterized protein n=1 Tax=Pyricularia grisea TaxID=148305 RepID=A0A6P8BKQ4_PYRGI|nr:uncharacterized protein PgNI_00068 [Pyricularia grisea]TLD17245.1 hypothetical protein PgNI_00068 [Pyricularia grisea]
MYHGFCCKVGAAAHDAGEKRLTLAETSNAEFIVVDAMGLPNTPLHHVGEAGNASRTRICKLGETV